MKMMICNLVLVHPIHINIDLLAAYTFMYMCFVWVGGWLVVTGWMVDILSLGFVQKIYEHRVNNGRYDDTHHSSPGRLALPRVCILEALFRLTLWLSFSAGDTMEEDTLCHFCIPLQLQLHASHVCTEKNDNWLIIHVLCVCVCLFCLTFTFIILP